MRCKPNKSTIADEEIPQSDIFPVVGIYDCCVSKTLPEDIWKLPYIHLYGQLGNVPP